MFVVVAALFGVVENFVGLGKLFEASFAGLVARIAVGMTFHHELAECLLDFGRSGFSRNAQHVIEAAPCLCFLLGVGASTEFLESVGHDELDCSASERRSRQAA